MAVNYRYRIHESHDSESCQVEGINLSKEWKEFDKELYMLKPFLRSEENLKGFIEKEIAQNAKYNGEFPGIFEKETLLVMSREKLVELAKFYCIATPNMTNEVLGKLIYSEQEEYLKAHPQGQQGRLKDALDEIGVELKDDETLKSTTRVFTNPSRPWSKDREDEVFDANTMDMEIRGKTQNGDDVVMEVDDPIVKEQIINDITQEDDCPLTTASQEESCDLKDEI